MRKIIIRAVMLAALVIPATAMGYTVHVKPMHGKALAAAVHTRGAGSLKKYYRQPKGPLRCYVGYQQKEAAGPRYRRHRQDGCGRLPLGLAPLAHLVGLHELPAGHAAIVRAQQSGHPEARRQGASEGRNQPPARHLSHQLVASLTAVTI